MHNNVDAFPEDNVEEISHVKVGNVSRLDVEPCLLLLQLHQGSGTNQRINGTRTQGQGGNPRRSGLKQR